MMTTTVVPPRSICGTAGHGDEVGKDKEDVDDPVRGLLQEVYFSCSSVHLLICL
jgi:hypothetical protein